MKDFILAGDIGGTKAHFILTSLDGDPRQPIHEARLSTVGSQSCEELIGQFLNKINVVPRWIGLGIPGPVIKGRVKPTNLAWEADQQAVAAFCGAHQAIFVNDLVATTLGVPFLRDDEQLILAPGETDEGPVAVIAPGTGLGEAFLLRRGQHWEAHASEAGHGDFAPRGSRQRDIHAFLEQELGQVSLENVASGLGIPLLWKALGKTSEHLQDDFQTEESIRTAVDPTPLIMAAALNPTLNPRSSAVAETLALILAQEAGNAALRLLATGGVVLAGGVTPRIIPWLKNPAVITAYRKNQALGGFLSQISLRASLNSGIAVLGAWAAAKNLSLI